MSVSRLPAALRPRALARPAPLFALRWWGVLLAASHVSLMSAGCGGSAKALQDEVARCAELQGAKASDNQPLAAEVNRIVQAGQAPRDLVRPLPNPAENAAAQLGECLTDGARLRLIPKLRNLMADQQYPLEPPQLVGILELLKDTYPLRSRIAQAEKAPQCVFDVRHDLGFFSRMRFLDDAAIACRLRLLAAAPYVADGQAAAACDELDMALTWIDRLAAVHRMEPRLLACQLRGQALLVVEAIAGGTSARRADLERLNKLLLRSLAAWPADASPLVGDRAVTMHSYEAVRVGLLDRIMTSEEKQSLKKQGLLQKLNEQTPAQIDQDELAYLDAMRVLIDTADQPYHQRAEQVDDLRRQLDPAGTPGGLAPLAALLFFPGTTDAVREMARDRATTEAWAIALATAGGFDLPPYQTNPVTGAPYEVERLAGALVVRLGDPQLRDPYARIAP